MPSDVAEIPEGDQVLRIELERRLEDLAGLVELRCLEQCLAEDNMTADVRRLLWQVGATERDCLVQITGLAVLVRQRGEVASRVLVEFFLQLVKAGGAGLSKPSGAPRDPGGETGQIIFS